MKRDVYEASGIYNFTPASRLALMAGYAHDRTGHGNNAQQIGATYEYSLSKATMLYAAAAFIENRNQAQFTLNGTAYGGVTVAPGANTRGAIIGMMHTF